MSQEVIDANIANIANAEAAQQEPQLSFNPQLMNLYLFMNRYSADIPAEKAEARKNMMTTLLVGDAVSRAIIEYNDAAQVNALLAKEVSDSIARAEDDEDESPFAFKPKKSKDALTSVNAVDSVRITV